MVAQETKVWEEQPWDTRKSYEAFFLYFFPQKDKPRNVSKAYRAAKPIRSTRPDVRQAPSNWRRWANGQDHRGNRKYYRQIGTDGDIRVLPVPSWENRANTWDENLRRVELKKREDEEIAFLKRMRTTSKAAWEHLIATWLVYKPTGNESLGEMTSATRTLATAIDMIHDGILTGTPTHDPDAGPAAGESRITDKQRVDAIGDMVLLAARRKSEAEKQDDGSADSQAPK